MRHGIVGCAFVLAGGLLLSGDLGAGSLEPPGPPAPTMKSLDQVESRVPISSLPFAITLPGSYYLTGNLVGVASQPGITISASNVTLDLNGFSLAGVPGSQDGITVPVVIRSVAIRNGVVRNWGGTGVNAILATDGHLEDLRVVANGSHGLLAGEGSTVRNTNATANALTGIYANLGTAVIGCTVRSNGGTGINLSSTSMATDCVAQLNNTGFSLDTGSRVVRSTARANVVGFSGGSSSSIEECTAEANTDDGIRVTSRGVVRGNVVRGNTNDGIHATFNENRIEDNEAADNGVGIRVTGSNNLVVKNSVSSNALEFQIAGGNKAGAISTDPMTANPWANFDL